MHDDLNLPPAMADEEAGCNVLTLYDALWERAAAWDGRPSDPEQALALLAQQQSEDDAPEVIAAGDPAYADWRERRKDREAF